MPTARRTHLYALAGPLLLAAASFLTGINWGLPGRWADPFLFGPRQPWTGAQVMALAGPWSPTADRGSDRPQHAAATTRATVLNATDADRAEIVRRYRLYSAQPDEMITFRALSRMRLRPLDLDPRLYQYGGLWIYPVGGLLRAAALVGLVDLRTDLAFYLDHPDVFARFYLVARLYSAAWGLLGVVIVYGLTRELTRRTLAAVAAAGAFAVMPVVINGAHEAKPHLAGTVLTLAAVWAAARHVRTGRGWAWAAALAGAASAMVLTGVAAWTVLPVMVWLRTRSSQEPRTEGTPAVSGFPPGPLTAGVPSVRGSVRSWPTLAAAVAIAAAVFVIANPYLPIDLLLHRERLASNVGNYGNFYHPTATGAVLWNAARRWVDGTSWAPAIVALVGLPLVARRPGPWWLLAAPTAFVAAQFTLLAADKPAEYARFALTLDVAAAVVAAAAVCRLPLRPREASLSAALLVAATALFGVRYDLNFWADAGSNSTRQTVARRLAQGAAPGRRLALPADPAPYNLPPVDLFAWQLELATVAPPGGLLVRPTDAAAAGVASPISWANKPFEVVPGDRVP